MKTSEVLNKAADLIEERGWWSHEGGGGGLCASNAICRASGSSYDAAHDALIHYLDAGGGFLPAEIIFNWNDEPGRTAEQVIATLRACAIIEAAKEVDDVVTVAPAPVAVS